MKESISIKGTREGLTITCGPGDLSALTEDLAHHLETQGAFFRGGRVALELGDRAVKENALAAISDLLTKHKMILRTVVATNPEAQQSAQALGLRLVSPSAQPNPQPPTASSSPGRARTPAPAPHALDGSRGTLVRHLLRSGQQIRHTGHVVIIGDVNVGAEVIAGADIVIWGRLYGIAHAGSMGDETAVVCALEMSPLQLRIGNVVARPEENVRKETYPEVAYVRDSIIVVEPWNRLP